MKIAQKIMLSFAVTAILLGGVVIGIEVYSRNELIKSATVDDAQHFENFFISLKEQDIKILSSALEAFTRNQSFKDAYLEMNREKLHTYAQPLLQDLKNKYGITHFYFILPDGHCFLRVHDKDLYGDLITRQSFLRARDTNKIASGLELGKTAFALRAVMPYYQEDKLVGYVEFAEEINHFLTKFKGDLHNEFVLIAQKKYLDRAEWQSIRKLAGMRDNWGDFSNYVVVDSTAGIKSGKVGGFLTEENIQRAESRGVLPLQIRAEDLIFGCGGFRIRDTEGHSVGLVLSLIDITAELSVARYIHFVVISVFFLLFIYIIGVGLFVSHAISAPITKLQHAMVEVGRGKLNSKIQIKTGDEIEHLAESFNKMTEDLKSASAALNAEKEKLNITLQSIGDGVIAVDTKENIILINKIAAQLTGWPQNEALGRPLSEVFCIVNGKTREPCENPVKKAINTKGIIGLANDTVLISRDGTERIILDSGSPVLDDKGDIRGVVLVFRDNTEHRKAEETIRKLSRAVEFSPAALFITDSKGVIEYVNRKFLELTGYAQDDLIGTTPRILRPDTLPPEARQRLWETISSGNEWRGEFLNKKKNGEVYWEFVLIGSIKDSQGKITNFLIAQEDITQRKLISEKLEEEKKMLEIFHESAVHQELDAIALKKEVNELLQKNGLPAKYTEVDEIERVINIEKEKENQS